jgi:predicted GNAT family acetyltransferase
VTVTDNPDRRRFELVVDGHLAELTYRFDGDRMVLVHTGVPGELEGKGIGGQLVRAAVEHAAERGIILVPRCPFARGWLEKHPDVADGARIEWPD